MKQTIEVFNKEGERIATITTQWEVCDIGFGMVTTGNFDWIEKDVLENRYFLHYPYGNVFQSIQSHAKKAGYTAKETIEGERLYHDDLSAGYDIE